MSEAMKKSLERDCELKVQLVDVTPPRTRRAWLPGAQFAAHQLDTGHWRREPAADLDWQRTPSWLQRRRMN